MSSIPKYKSVDPEVMEYVNIQTRKNEREINSAKLMAIREKKLRIQTDIRNDELKKINLNLIKHIRRKDKPAICEVIKDQLNRAFYPKWYKRQEARRERRLNRRDDRLRGVNGKCVAPRIPRSVLHRSSSMKTVELNSQKASSSGSK